MFVKIVEEKVFANMGRSNVTVYSVKVTESAPTIKFKDDAKTVEEKTSAHTVTSNMVVVCAGRELSFMLTRNLTPTPYGSPSENSTVSKIWVICHKISKYFMGFITDNPVGNLIQKQVFICNYHEFIQKSES